MPPDLIEALAHIQGRRILLVGHEPLLSATVVHLLGGQWLLDLKKAGACTLEVDALPPKRAATLLWLMTSRQLRSITKGSSK